MSTSIKVKFRPSTIVDHEGSIYFQIIHDRVVRQLSSDYKVFPSEWNDKRSTIVIEADSERRSLLQSIRLFIRWNIERLTKINNQLEATGISFSTDDIIDEYNRYKQEYSLFKFMEKLITQHRQNGKIRTSETYQATLNSFKRYQQGQDIMLDHISPETMEGYETWLRNRGLIPNSISFYTRILRAVYNRAVEHGIVESRNPFRHVYTGIDKTIKRALPLDDIKRIKALDLSQHPQLDFARDIFLLSFYLRGMSFIDLAFLKKSDLRNGYITYRRHKTGQKLIIEWTKEMQFIRDKYPENTSDYLLPIIKQPTKNERSVYRNISFTINLNLKKIAAKAGICMRLTLYVARHSWATAAKSKGIPLSVISEGMGHDSETTTQIYLASLDSSTIDKANSLILSCL